MPVDSQRGLGAGGAMEVEKVPVVPQTEQQKKIIKDNQ